MAEELAFVLINPYTISKSRTGGVVSRYLQRTDLNLVAARMFGPGKELVRRYSELVRNADPTQREMCELIARYIETSYSPHPGTGKPRRVMLLLFEGEDAVAKTWNVTGSATLRWGSGQTIRDTYGDYIVDESGNVRYFEPAVLVAPTVKRVRASLMLWTEHSKSDGGIIESALDVPSGERVEKTLVLLKPDNFHYHSSRAGSIVDTLSASGLRIVGVKKFNMTVAQAELFYGPVRDALERRFKESGRKRAGDALRGEFGFEIPDDAALRVSECLAPLYANSQFEEIVKFMTGYVPSRCSREEKEKLGSEECLALVYEGVDAVGKIRSIIGATDPHKAIPGSVRREFGTDIMVNAAHASDSPENAAREIAIVKVDEDTITPVVRKYYGG